MCDLVPGRALDIACGQGRNAFYLAQLGFEVDAVDLSDVAIDWVQKAAVCRNATINPIHLDLEAEPLPSHEYQIIVCFNYLQRSLFPRIPQLLAPNGLLIFETFHCAHLDLPGNSRMRREYLLEDNELLNAFTGLRILYYREGVFLPKEEMGSARGIASLVAQKKV